MTRPNRPLRRHIICGTLILIAGIESPGRAQRGIFKHAEKVTIYHKFKDGAGRFTLEYPATNWRIIPGSGSVLVGFTQQDGEASVLVDYTKLRLVLAPSEIDNTFAELEVHSGDT